MLYELFTGDLLFQTHDSYQHMALIVARLEKRIPYSIVMDCEKNQFFGKSIYEERQVNYNSIEIRTEETKDSKVSLPGSKAT